MVTTKKVHFAWKPEYSVHHGGIDGQHQRLVTLVNDLFSAMAEGHGRAAVDGVVSGLTTYTKTHFAYEEQQMERARYPGTALHKEYHRKLLQRVEQYSKELHSGQTVNTVELAAFLKDWLLHHIGEADRPLAAYLAAKS